MGAHLECLTCGAKYALSEARCQCECGGMLDVWHDLAVLHKSVSRRLFDSRLGSRKLPDSSGVWRFRELIFPVADELIVSRPEGNTNLYRSSGLSDWVGVEELLLKHEGENPTGSFKDRGMTVGVTQAKVLGCKVVACASTGNTSSSLAAYGALGGLRVLVFVPQGKISLSKLSQTLAYGATTLEVRGDFDAAMRLVREVCQRFGVYLLNSLNPLRIEGQKSAVIELLQELDWEPPDWVVLPAGNLGNLSSYGKAIHELLELGLIDRPPRLAAIQAHGANPFWRSYVAGFRERVRVSPPQTVATAIRIGDPVSYEKAVRALAWTDGVVAEVADGEIMEAKARVDGAGIGCEPASASAVAGVRKLVREGVIARKERVVAVLTGHILKDPETTLAYHQGSLAEGFPLGGNRPLTIEPTLPAVERILEVKL